MLLLMWGSDALSCQHASALFAVAQAAAWSMSWTDKPFFGLPGAEMPWRSLHSALLLSFQKRMLCRNNCGG